MSDLKRCLMYMSYRIRDGVPLDNIKLTREYSSLASEEKRLVDVLIDSTQKAHLPFCDDVEVV